MCFLLVCAYFCQNLNILFRKFDSGKVSSKRAKNGVFVLNEYNNGLRKGLREGFTKKVALLLDFVEMRGGPLPKFFVTFS